MRVWSVTLICALLLTSVAFAGEKKAKTKKIEGRIVKIDNKRIMIEMPDEAGGPGVMRTYAFYDENTTVTLDGKESDLRHLAQRMHVVITMDSKLMAKTVAADSGNDKKKQ